MLQNKEIRIVSLLVIDTLFFFLEIIVGYAVHSLALVADSFHMLNDVFSLVVALWAVRVAKKRGVDSKYTYGWQRAEILGALVNGVFLVALCLSIFLEAIQRFVEPQVISNPVLILVVGCLGLVSNIVGLALFHEHDHDHGHSHSHSHSHSESAEDEEHDINHSSVEDDAHGGDGDFANVDETSRLLPEENIIEIAVATATADSDSGNNNGPAANHSQPSLPRKKKSKSLNMEGVFLHVLGDALGNIGVIVTALFIWRTNYSWKYYTDPLISLVITAIIFSSALPLCKKAGSILLQGVPHSINAEKVKHDLISLPGVVEIHNLHIWLLTEDFYIATLHVSLILNEDEFMELAAKIQSVLQGHGIRSITVQPEFLNRAQDRPNSPRSLGLSTSVSEQSLYKNTGNGTHSPPQCVLLGNTSSGGLASGFSGNTDPANGSR